MFSVNIYVDVNPAAFGFGQGLWVLYCFSVSRLIGDVDEFEGAGFFGLNTVRGKFSGVCLQVSG